MILQTQGAAKVIALSEEDGPGRVVGIHLVGSRVGELIAEAQLIYNWDAEPSDVAQLIHPHPTQSEAIGEAHLALAGKPLHVHEPLGVARTMSVSVSMPQLGESVTEGTVTRWLKKEGERVEADEPLLEVSTDKVDTEIPSPASGILRGIAVDEDETVAVGAQLATIDDGASGAAAPAADDSSAAGGARRPGAARRSPRPRRPAGTVPGGAQSPAAPCSGIAAGDG